MWFVDQGLQYHPWGPHQLHTAGPLPDRCTFLTSSSASGPFTPPFSLRHMFEYDSPLLKAPHGPKGLSYQELPNMISSIPLQYPTHGVHAPPLRDLCLGCALSLAHLSYFPFLPSSFSLSLCMHVSVSVHQWTRVGCTHIYVLVGMKARGNLSIFFRHCPPSFLRQDLWLS